MGWKTRYLRGLIAFTNFREKLVLLVFEDHLFCLEVDLDVRGGSFADTSSFFFFQEKECSSSDLGCGLFSRR